MADLASAQRRVPLPGPRALRPGDVLAIAVGNGLLIVGMWIRHGGLNGLTTPGTLLIAAGQLTALLGTYLALIGLVLMSRSPWLDRLIGLPRLASWHRWVGFGCVWLLVAHTVLATAGFTLTSGGDAVAETLSLLTTYPYVLMATVGLVMLIAVGVTSVRMARRGLSYETWYFIHLYAYLGMALGFAHQLVIGTDFLSDPVAQAYWIGLYLVTIVAIVVFRVGQPVQLFFRHRLRVAHIAAEAHGVVSVYVTGRELDRLTAQAGQYFLWRFLAGDGWWRAHPFSLSAAPNDRYLRLTVKATGDSTNDMQRLAIGTPVFVEGPYGAFTADPATRPRILLIAGGIGVAPLRASRGDARITWHDHPHLPRQLLGGRRVRRRARRAGEGPRRATPLPDRPPVRAAARSSRGPQPSPSRAGHSRTRDLRVRTRRDDQASPKEPPGPARPLVAYPRGALCVLISPGDPPTRPRGPPGWRCRRVVPL
jgi:predicted ferric reductase